MPSAPQRDLTKVYQKGLALQKAGRLSEARAAFQTILMARPQTAEALFQIGRIDAASGDAKAAENHLRKALALKPNEAAIWQALYEVLSGSAAKRLVKEARKAGVALGSEDEANAILSLVTRDAEAAEAQALTLVKAAPHGFWPAYALGKARLARSNWSGALGPLEKAVERAPSHKGAQISLGICLSQIGQPIRAEDMLAPHVPGDVDATQALAQTYLACARPGDAVDLLRKLKPGGARKAPVLKDLALALAAMGAGDQAVSAMQSAVQAGVPGVALAHAMASSLQESGQIDAAMVVLDAAIAEAPKEPSLWTHRAQFKQSAGALDEADTDLVTAFDLDPGFAEAFRAYMAGRKVTADDPVHAEMQAHLGRPGMDAKSRRVLNYAAAKALDDQREAQAAFAHLTRANRLMYETFPYSFEADVDEARALVRNWSQLDGIAPEGPDDPVFFVTGLPRSGTTLVETILAAHSTVAAGGEMPFLNRALLPVMETVRSGAPDPALFAQAGQRYLEAGRRKTGAALFTDKAISTFSRIGYAARALPGARFVVLRRDPRDVGLSLFRNMFGDGKHRYANDLVQIGRYIRLHDALVAFWADALPDRVHIVDYEALTADPEPNIRALVDFAGLDWEDACLAPEKSGRRIDTLSFATARQPITRSAVAGWKRYETDLQPMLDALDQTEIGLFSGP